MEKLSELINFESEKTTLSSTLLIKLRFQEYSCKSDIAIFHGGSLEITLTVPLSAIPWWFSY